MKRLYILTFLAIAAIITFGSTATQAAPLPKVTICHIPPGNPDNAHTITISENALQAHINNHGDIPGACGLNCEDTCPDDGNACTANCNLATGDCDYEPVDCSDSSLCTADTCDPAVGCLFDPVECPEIECQVGICTEPDGGNCIYAPVPNGTDCEPDGMCENGVCDSGGPTS